MILTTWLLLLLEPTSDAVICKKTLDSKDIDVLRYAIDNDYWYTMFIGKLFTKRVKKKIDSP
jgi:hypothetical protein